MSWITSSEGARLFRPGHAPPLRGTLLDRPDRELVLYTKGSVDFYSTYPGMYVPRPIGIRPARPVRSPRETGAEILGADQDELEPDPARRPGPVTLRTANQVKAILRFCPPEPGRRHPLRQLHVRASARRLRDTARCRHATSVPVVSRPITT